MTTRAVEVAALTVRRGRNEVLHDLSLTVGAGAVTGLLGPSGSGKTTLMRAVVGLQRMQGGTVTVLGLPAGHRLLRAQIGYAPQGASVYRDLTVTENVRYFASCLGVHEREVGRVVSEVDLSPYADRLTGRLSGGQLSRVSLAVALLGRPRLLVLDEPTVGLDPVLREQLWRLFAGLAADGTALLVSSHVMDEAERCSDLILLRDGALLTQESPQALKQRTAADSLDAAFLSLVRDAGEAA